MKRRQALLWIARGAVAAGAFVLLLWFSTAHYGQRVTLDLWILTLRDVPLPFALYGAVIVGMAFILLIGLRTDLETRRLLERYRAIAELDRAAQRVRGAVAERFSGGEGAAASPEERADEEEAGGATAGDAGGGVEGGAGRSRREDVPQTAGPD